MKVAHIAAEMAPIAKVGGLGDVVGSLSRALKKQKVDTFVILPKYKIINTQCIKNLKIIKNDLKIFEKNKWQNNKVFQGYVKNVKVYLIDPEKHYFNRDKIYGYKDDVARFLYFCKCALEFLKSNIKDIDVLHLHDWHTAFMAPYYKEIYSKEEHLNIKSIVLSIHNLGYQGQCMAKQLEDIDVNPKLFLHSKKLGHPKKPKTINLLKGGLIYSDAIIPVSPTYAKEILTKKHGHQLSPMLKKFPKNKIKGILNGIDYKTWNPKKDKSLAQNYSSTSSIETILKAKELNKEKLRKYLNLKDKNVPIIASIGRLAEQKAPKLIKHAILKSLKKNAQFVLLGTPFSKEISHTFHKLKRDLKNNRNVSINFKYDECLCHMIYAACDFIIVPSIFEPCGLTQIIGFRYGALPIVRKTGGLADTVFDLQNPKIPKNKKNGFTFKNVSIEELDKTLNRAIKFWYEKQEKFQTQIKKNMKINHCWQKSIKKYIAIYKRLIK
ncbi:MAG: glycogen synthase [Parachlamydiales bacterium]|nr:glycogen synthase [Parachlamydiales bacterium]